MVWVKNYDNNIKGMTYDLGYCFKYRSIQGSVALRVRMRALRKSWVGWEREHRAPLGQRALRTPALGPPCR